jgi:hypothetical protein
MLDGWGRFTARKNMRAGRLPVEQLADELDEFFQIIPSDRRYHLEIRTPAYLEEPVFTVLEKHGADTLPMDVVTPNKAAVRKVGGKNF